ncbi:Putative GTP binding domain, P-loop containing nucleoside triphosphate hydrolase [Colletotrichum destructivum]|uniref:GTP binding domain, P-loop containing nucleoside triphosphate hydrolase n=1 Tax=Colletotrichum destructivum TaxID=34406 RepID=A0AAX4J4G6_9PEZI|nr:Putative GTP binding domain, P-loop containing nucleoside triphosphate hydrolase [Colletotrichum destructivum]
MSSTQELASNDIPVVFEGTGEDWPIIAVMGVTGAGKSTFISELVNNKNIIIGHTLKSETKLTAAYYLDHEVHGRIELLDTPGFDDTFSADTEVLREIAARMSRMYEDGKKLAGIIYLHRISDNRMTGSALRNLRMFKELCGENAYKHVVLATSMWSKENFGVAKRREHELIGDGGFWAEMATRGSPVRRWHNCDSAFEVIDLLMSEKEAHGPATLQIQRELVDEQKRLERTAAGQEVDRELNKIRDMFEKQLQRLRDENRVAMDEQDVEWQTALLEQRKELEKQQHLIEDGQKAMQVSVAELHEENREKYSREILRLKDELERAKLATETKEAEIEANTNRYESLLKKLGGKTESEQNDEDQKELQDTEEEKKKLLEELEKKKKEQSKLTAWLLLLGHMIATATSIAVQLVV